MNTNKKRSLLLKMRRRAKKAKAFFYDKELVERLAQEIENLAAEYFGDDFSFMILYDVNKSWCWPVAIIAEYNWGPGEIEIDLLEEKKENEAT